MHFIEALVLAAISLCVWGHTMRGGLPKMDLFLASAAASPVATGKVIAFNSTSPEAIRFFNAPIYEFTISGIPVFLTAPDVLALASSVVLLVRFVAWAVAPLVKPHKKEDE